MRKVDLYFGRSFLGACLLLLGLFSAAILALARPGGGHLPWTWLPYLALAPSLWLASLHLLRRSLRFREWLGPSLAGVSPFGIYRSLPVAGLGLFLLLSLLPRPLEASRGFQSELLTMDCGGSWKAISGREGLLAFEGRDPRGRGLLLDRSGPRFLEALQGERRGPSAWTFAEGGSPLPDLGFRARRPGRKKRQEFFSAGPFRQLLGGPAFGAHLLLFLFCLLLPLQVVRQGHRSRHPLLLAALVPPLTGASCFWLVQAEALGLLGPGPALLLGVLVLCAGLL